MHLVDDEDLVAVRGRGEFDAFLKVTDLVNAAVASRVYLDHIKRLAVVYLRADAAVVAGLAMLFEFRVLRARFAVRDFSQKAGGGCLSRATRAIEEIGVSDLVLP